ncbi:hypothetical protein [Flagellimonas sp. 2504JD4-2]
MRTISISFLLCLLLQSCHSYKSLNNGKEQLLVDKKYKLKLGRYENKYIKVKITELTDTAIIGISKGEEIQILYKDIWEVKKRKFSAFKTLLLVATVFVGGLVIYLIEGPNLGNIGYFTLPM